MTALKLPALSPAEVSFIGRVVAGVQKHGAHVDEVKRLGDKGLRIHAVSESDHTIEDVHIGDMMSDNWAARGHGGPVTPYDVVSNICKRLKIQIPAA